MAKAEESAKYSTMFQTNPNTSEMLNSKFLDTQTPVKEVILLKSYLKRFRIGRKKVLKSEKINLKIYCKLYCQAKLVPEASMAPAHLAKPTEEQKRLFELQKENKDLLENITS